MTSRSWPGRGKRLDADARSPAQRVGAGPVATAVQDVTGRNGIGPPGGIPNLLIANSQSNNVLRLPGVGGGFFNDADPAVFDTGAGPQRVFAGAFDSTPGLDLVTINAGANDFPFFPNFGAGISIPTTGDAPVEAEAGDFNVDGFSDLLVVHNGDGLTSLVQGGPDGLDLKDFASHRPRGYAGGRPPVCPTPLREWSIMKSSIRSILCFSLLTALAWLPPAGAGAAPEAAKVPILLDTDIGDDIDDALALALALVSPELDVRGVTTTQGDAFTRALIVCRLLHLIDRADIPVASGRLPQEPPDHRGQMQFGLRPAFRKRPIKEDAVEFLHGQLKARPGELTLVALGPLTNVAELLTRHPGCKPWIKRIVLMGGAVRVGYEGKPPAEPEWNIKSDIKAARTVLAAGIPLTVAPLDATTVLKLEEPLRRRLFAGAFLNQQLHALYQLGDRPTPTLFDPVAIALCFEEKFCRMEELRLDVDDKGLTRAVEGKPNARVATSIQGDFLKWYVERLTAAGPAVPAARKPANIATLVERGALPHRVHVVEDYETEIERRWWLSGKPETKNVPPGSTRAGRAVLTNDFDDRMGDPKAMYQAVIFNPVPGPPMGKHTRLSFRFWLQGTDALRVQIYSLTNGYHRHLTLTGLPEGRWESATVDMTQARRPDGSGGPLDEDERIDDIQFYAHPSAELLIDDIVLYDAAAPGEKRPFPRRIHFTGWFDTGRQGKEWPGTFDIVAKEKPLTWKAARSVPHPDQDASWVRLHLRGERPLGETTRLRFRYRLTGADSLRVLLVNRTAKHTHLIERKDLVREEWAEVTLDFSAGSKRGDGSTGKPGKGDRVDEIHFLVPKGAELLLDDVLLYEPGGSEPETKPR